MRFGLLIGGLTLGLALGAGSEWAGYGYGPMSPVDWGPDLAVGLVWIGCGLWAWGLDRRTEVPTGAVGTTGAVGGDRRREGSAHAPSHADADADADAHPNGVPPEADLADHPTEVPPAVGLNGHPPGAAPEADQDDAPTGAPPQAGGVGRRAGVLAGAVGVVWFLGGYLPAATYWHRGVLVQLLVTYPGWKPESRLAGVAVLAGYGAALLYAPWRGELSSALLALALVGVLVRLRATSVGRQRRYRTVALQSGVALALVLVGGSAARSAVPMREAVRPALLAFEVVLCAIAVLLMAGLRRPAAAPVTDLVVELGESRWVPLSSRLARLLGDPDLEVGYWVPAARSYVDGEGRPVPVPPPGARRCATRIEREGRPFAVVVHDIAVREEPRLVAAVAAATRLTTSHAALQAEVHARLKELTASRRRLVVAADEERARLEERLRQGAERRLRAIGAALAATAPDDPAVDEPHRARAADHLARSLDELRATAHGLRPRELADGTGPALASLAGTGPVEVRLHTRPERFPAEVEAAVYYICAEAVANAVKHSGAGCVSIAVRRAGAVVTLEIEDDGEGGADPARGSGLVGISDRIATLGGELSVHSPPGAGTRLVARIPVEDSGG